MDLRELINGLSRPETWPRPPGRVEVVQTHASVVLLGEDEVYKLKKPVDFGFLDYSDLEKRRLACEAEVRLNRRLAPGVYLGVVPVTAEPRLGGEGEAIEWAVHMRRLPEGKTLRSLLAAGVCDAALLERVARTLASFFAAADRGPHVAQAASFAELERNCLENFDHAAAHVGQTLTKGVLERSRALTERELAAQRSLIEDRVGRGMPRDGHGDLRLDHVYEIEGEILVVDCIEFNDRFRFQDPVCDVAFLVMELNFAGRRDLAASFADSYFEAAGDAEGRALLPLFIAYRQAVRGKVRSLEAAEEEVPAGRRESARRLARAHFLAGLSELAQRGERPALALVGGPPACGKSTLARGLAAASGFERFGSDETRKRLAGLAPTQDGAAAFAQGLYTPSWTKATYDELLRLARERLSDGRRVVVDATFAEDSRRLPFLELAREFGLPAVWLDLQLDAAESRRRLLARHDDSSDANAEVQDRSRAGFEPPGETSAAFRIALLADGSPEDTLTRALAALRAAALA